MIHHAFTEGKGYFSFQVQADGKIVMNTNPLGFFAEPKIIKRIARLLLDVAKRAEKGER